MMEGLPESVSFAANAIVLIVWRKGCDHTVLGPDRKRIVGISYRRHVGLSEDSEG